MSFEQLVAGLEYLEAEIKKQMELLRNFPLFSIEWDIEHSVLESLLIEKLSINGLLNNGGFKRNC